MGIPEEAGKVATSAVDVFRNNPGLLFLTIVNIAFLAFTYMIGGLVLKAFDEQQAQMHQRYLAAIKVVDRCINEAFDEHSVGPDDRGKRL